MIALTLEGHISNESHYGRIGLRLSGNKIVYVYKHSPAFDAGLVQGDKVISADGTDGTAAVDGEAGTYVYLVINTKDGIVKELKILRVESKNVY
jgi:predicted metalloprotease with PDZ domain